MGTVKLGLQIYSLREAFAADPAGTLKQVAAMGYEGVEFAGGRSPETGTRYQAALADAGLSCFGCLTSWKDVQPDTIGQTIAYNRALGSPFIIIGSVPTALVSTPAAVQNAVAAMGEIQRTINGEGFITGYHNHDSDFFNVVGGKPFFEHVFDQTPDDFAMLLDTGNALAAGYRSIDLLRKYPRRSPFLHIKGHSEEKGYLAYIGDDDFDWPAVIRCAVETGGARTFSIEFGARGEYDPFERAKTSLDRIKELAGQLGVPGS